jgi:hypothetical protein
MYLHSISICVKGWDIVIKYVLFISIVIITMVRNQFKKYMLSGLDHKYSCVKLKLKVVFCWKISFLFLRIELLYLGGSLALMVPKPSLIVLGFPAHPLSRTTFVEAFNLVFLFLL